MSRFEVHEHCFISGPRAGGHYERDGKWHTGTFSHSHEGGGVPHCHPDSGPSNYRYRAPKVTKRPTGEQFDVITSRTEEENTFELVVTDSAMINAIGNTPLEALGFPAANRMIGTHRMKCIVRDERKKIGGAA